LVIYDILAYVVYLVIYDILVYNALVLQGPLPVRRLLRSNLEPGHLPIYVVCLVIYVVYLVIYVVYLVLYVVIQLDNWTYTLLLRALVLQGPLPVQGLLRSNLEPGHLPTLLFGMNTW